MPEYWHFDILVHVDSMPPSPSATRPIFMNLWCAGNKIVFIIASRKAHSDNVTINRLLIHRLFIVRGAYRPSTRHRIKRRITIKRRSQFIQLLVNHDCALTSPTYLCDVRTIWHSDPGSSSIFRSKQCSNSRFSRRRFLIGRSDWDNLITMNDGRLNSDLQDSPLCPIHHRFMVWMIERLDYGESISALKASAMTSVV